MKNRSRSIGSKGFAIVFAAVLSIACSDKDLTTAAMRPAPVIRPDWVNSEHFYQGSDGYYYWDGQPPPGDQDPSVISRAEAFGTAPRPGTKGWVSGEMDYIGDQAKIDLTYSVDSAGHPKYHGSQASSGWQFRSFVSRGVTQTFTYSHTLEDINGKCDFSLLVGGTAYAHKSFPFGFIALSLIKFLVSIDLSAGMVWGEVSRPMDANSDPGISCDDDLSHSQCDNENTSEIEYCPVDGDPANPPYTGAQNAGNPESQGEYGGYSSPGGYVGAHQYCTVWIDWYVSIDGGKHFTYQYRSCVQWEMA